MSNSAASFIERAQRAMIDDPDEAFGFIKTQKLLVKSRDLKTVRLLADSLAAWARLAPIPKVVRSRVRKLCQVSARVQELFDNIGRRTAQVWSPPADGGVLATLDRLETTNRRVLEQYARITDQAVGPDDVMERHILLTAEVRRHCDAATGLLRQIACRDEGAADMAHLSSLDEPFELAQQADLVLDMFDNYSYSNWNVTVEDAKTRFWPSQDQLAQASQWASRRIHHADLAGSHDPERTLSGFIDEASRRDDLSLDHSSTDLFLLDGAQRWLLEEARSFGAKDMERRKRLVNDVFDPASTFTIANEPVKVEDLLNLWRAVSVATTCVRVWQAAALRHGKTIGIAPILWTQPGLQQFVLAELGMAEGTVTRLLDSVTMRARRHEVRDLYYRPLVRLDDGRIAMSPTIIETGRWERNIFRIAGYSNSHEMKIRGSRPLQHLAELLAESNWRECRSVAVGDTDVDIAFCKDQGRVFVAQAKVVVEPDTAYERWLLKMKLRVAAGQLARCLKSPDFVARLTARLHVDVSYDNIVPFLLTNAWECTGATVGGYMVIDFSYLRMLFNGGVIPILQRDSARAFKIIAGNTPTPIELDRLLKEPLHKSMFKREVLFPAPVKIGNHEVTVPATLRLAIGGGATM